MRNRKQHKVFARYEEQTRQWAHKSARDLVLSIVSSMAVPANPYEMGVVLDPRERVLAECPLRLYQENLPTDGPAVPPILPWLVTSDRIVGRLGDDRLHGWGWERIRGCCVVPSMSPESVTLDCDDGSRLDWTGPGVAPLAVTAVYRLHERQALIDHPGLAAIRVKSASTSRGRPFPVALPTSSASGIRLRLWM